MAIVNVIVIHGVGDLRKAGSSYSEPLQQNIRKHFGVAAPDALAFWEVNWSDIGEAEEDALINNKHVLPDARMPGAGSFWPPNHALGEVIDKLFGASVQARRFLLKGIGDALIYSTEQGGKEIRQRLIDQVLAVRHDVRARDPQRKHYVSIIAHSLGSVIAYDVCALFGEVLGAEVAGLGLSHLFTMGSPLALFSLLKYGDEVRRYARRGVHLERPDRSGTWLNFYDQQDPIAFPLRDVYPPAPDNPERNYTIQDIRVQTGTFHAHTNYFLNDVIAREIAQRLRMDYEKDR